MFASIPRWLRLVVYTQVVLVFAIPLGGWLLESALEAADLRAYPPPGRMISVNGRRIHLYCEGERGQGPLVVFNAGIADNGLVWRGVQTALGGRLRACAIDRAGLGWSDPGKETGAQDRGIVATARELHHILASSGEAPPYLVVGHGLGALQGLVFAAENLTDISGLVLVDPLPPECLGERLRGIASEIQGSEQPAIRGQIEEIISRRGACPEGDGGTPLLGWLARFGMVRALAGDRFDGSAPMPELLAVHRALRFRAQAADAMLAETKSAYIGISQAREALKQLANRPFAILSPGLPGNYPGDWPRIEQQAEPATLAFERAQLGYLQRRQRQMAAEIPGANCSVASESGRYIQISEPHLVAHAIFGVAASAARQPPSRTQPEPVTLTGDEQF